MLKRIRIKGYKSLRDVEATLEPLTVLFGPNASGKSNFLDALQLLSRMATSRTLKEAFDPPYRGKPLESFSFGGAGLKGLIEQDHLRFSIEADLVLSDTVVKSVEREIRDMRQPSGNRSSEAANGRAKVRERHLRYRIVVEMLPKSGVLRVADEYLAALTRKGEPSRSRKPFLERHDDKLRLRKGRRTQDTPIACSTTASCPCRTTPRTTPTSRLLSGSWQAGCSSTSSRANECEPPVPSRKRDTWD